MNSGKATEGRSANENKLAEKNIRDAGGKAQSGNDVGMTPNPTNSIQISPVLEDKLQMRSKEDSVTPRLISDIQQKQTDDGTDWVQQIKGQGQPLPNDPKQELEQKMNTDFSDVRIHTDHSSAKLNDEINSEAFTLGNDIYFNKENYQPATKEGKHLLAHELTYVTQQSSQQPVIRRKPKKADPANLPIENIEVPEIEDPAAIESVKFDYTYQWQNPVLRETILSQREESLKAFLLSQRELEIDGVFAQGNEIDPEQLKNWIIDHRADLEKSLELLVDEVIPADELIEHSKIIVAQYEQALEQEKQANKEELKSVGGIEIIQKREELEEKLNKLIDGPGKYPPEQELAYLEKRRYKKTEEEYQEEYQYYSLKLDKKQGKIQSLLNEIEVNEEAYQTIVFPIIKEEDSINKQLENAKNEVDKAIEKRINLKAEIKSLKAEIKGVPEINPTRPLDRRMIIKWEKERFRKDLDQKNHEELVGEINKLFADDTDFKRFPKWIRYGVMHFSGVKYDDAHYVWQDPRRLLKSLKEEELKTISSEKERILKAMAMHGLGEGSMTIPKKNRDDFRKFDKLKSKNKPEFQQIIHFEDELTELHMQLREVIGNRAATEGIIEKIDLLETEINDLKSGLSKSDRTYIDDAYAKRDKGLIAVYLADSKKKIGELSEGQALFLLVQMKDKGQIPDPVWKEIMVFTSLKTNVTDPNWFIDRTRRALKWHTPENQEKAEEMSRWQRVLKAGFSASMDNWRSHHKETLGANILVQMRCDALGSNIQHTRQVSQPGGLTANAQQYFDDSKIKPATTFKRLESIDDLRQGTSMFYMGWQKVPKNKDKLQLEAKIKELEKKEEKRKARKKELSDWQKKVLKEAREKLKNLDNKSDYLPESTTAPGNWKMVSPFAGHKIVLGGKEISEGMTDENGWTYSVGRKGANGNKITIIRVKPNPFYHPHGIPRDKLDLSGKPNKEILVEWLQWTHQVTVMYVNKTGQNVHALDTWASTTGPAKLGAIGTSILKMGDLLKRDNVFVGYSDSPSDHPNLDQNLEGLERSDSPVPDAE